MNEVVADVVSKSVSQYDKQDFIQPFVSGGSMKLSGGTIDFALGRGLRRGGVPLPMMGVRGVIPGKILKFETQFGAFWCISARN